MSNLDSLSAEELLRFVDRNNPEVKALADALQVSLDYVDSLKISINELRSELSVLRDAVKK